MGSRASRTLVATAPDGTEVTRETSGSYDTAGLLQAADGHWLIAAHGWSRNSVYNRTHARYNRGSYQAMHVSDLVEQTAPVIREYFGTHAVRITSYFCGGQWRDVLAADGSSRCFLGGGRAALRSLARDGIEAVMVSANGRSADFQMTVLVKSMNARKASA